MNSTLKAKGSLTWGDVTGTEQEVTISTKRLRDAFIESDMTIAQVNKFCIAAGIHVIMRMVRKPEMACKHFDPKCNICDFGVGPCTHDANPKGCIDYEEECSDDTTLDT